jgi:hypothetical protein
VSLSRLRRGSAVAFCTSVGAAFAAAAAIRTNAAAETTRWPRRHVVVVLIFLGTIIAHTEMFAMERPFSVRYSTHLT